MAADKLVALNGQVVGHVAQRLPQIAASNDAVGLLGIGWRREPADTVRAELEQLDRCLDALETVVAVALDVRMINRHVPQCIASAGSHQCLSAAGKRHHARRERLGEAFDLDGLCTARDVGGGVLAQRDIAKMQADARHKPEPAQCRVVGEGEVCCILNRIEQQEEPVGSVDLAPVVLPQQRPRATVVPDPDASGLHIAKALDQQRAVDDVSEEEHVSGHGRFSR